MGDDKQHLSDLLNIKKIRLQVLEVQAARYGNDCPAHIILEVEDLRKEIQRLEESSPLGLALVEWGVSAGDYYTITARLAYHVPTDIAIVKDALIQIHDIRQHPVTQMDNYVGASIRAVKVAKVTLPLEKKIFLVSLNPNRRFPYGEVEDLKLSIEPRVGYQYIISFGFQWHTVGEQSLKKLEAGYLQIGHRGLPSPQDFAFPPPASDFHKPTMGNPNLDPPITLKSPVWADKIIG